jgi:hypothetical protein
VECDWWDYYIFMPDQGQQKESEKARALDRVVADAIQISERFSAKPVFGPTGKGYLKSEGVKPLKKLKKQGEDR